MSRDLPGGRAQPRLVHLTTTDMSLDWLLRPQLTAFAAAGFEVIGMSAPGPHVATLEAAGIRHVAVPSLTRTVSVGRDGRAAAELLRAFRRLQPDIVHTHNPKPGVIGRVAARLAGVPAVVNTVHGLYATDGDPRVKRWPVYAIERAAAAFSHAELLQNPEDLPVLRRLGLPERRVSVLGNGVDLDRFDATAVTARRRRTVRADIGVDPSDVVVLAVGRLVWEKGYRELFDAAARLTAVGCRLVVVGPHDSEKRGAIGSAAIRRAEQAGVIFLGARQDIVDIYGAADVCVLASHREGFPRSAMEAAAMGLPIVATNVRGCRQVVADGETGLLVPVRDAAALASALGSLALDPERRRAMGAAAIERARDQFDDRSIIARTLDVYAELLPARASLVPATAA